MYEGVFTRVFPATVKTSEPPYTEIAGGQETINMLTVITTVIKERRWGGHDHLSNCAVEAIRVSHRKPTHLGMRDDKVTFRGLNTISASDLG
ncbi:MAG: hypothetical protein CL678_16035 [Bdellovibrionaceae bacterium]|nr:hypothetical protein [Pseudobdellovibrionaceae bacterium]